MQSGPGKFETCGNYALTTQYLYEQGADEELGESESFGWYGLFIGKIKGRGPFYAILSENSQGFVDVDWYDTEEKCRAKWSKLESEYEEFNGPQEDDLTTEDHRHFYQNGKLVLEIAEDANMEQALRDYMDQECYWPNVWFISDHGNTFLILIYTE